MDACPSCGTDNPERAKFCSECGAVLAPAGPPRETRKTVTIVFCDVTGSTSLGEGLDPESLRKVMTRYYDTVRRVLERHGGTVEKFIGDAVVAVFGIPHVHEDDALRAVRAVAEMREALTDLNKELERDRGVTLKTRTGIHTGEVMAGDAASGHAMMAGDAGNVAARLEQAAAPGEILLSATTRRLVRDAVAVQAVEALTLKGKAEPVPAYRLLDVHPGAPGHARRMDSPMVGRERELALLRQALDRAVTERAVHLFTILGAAGVGKSRLIDEFLPPMAGEVRILHGRCLPYGEAIALWPLVQVVRQAAGLDLLGAQTDDATRIEALLGEEPDAHRVAADVAQLIGATDDAGALSIEENFWAVRRLFETVARRQPLVLVFDDLHWAEPTFLDLLDSVTDLTQDAPILMMCMARPELLDVRPGWGGGKFNATSLLLEPLPEDQARELLANLVDRAELPGEVADRVLAAAEGNPLFVEETLAMLMDEGILDSEDGRVVVASEVPELVIPPTIQGILAARLDRLSPAERETLERASIVGKVFYSAAVNALGPERDPTDVHRDLASLTRKQLVAPDRSDLPREDAFRFRHILLRDATYAALAKETRADLHERFAAWLEGAHGREGPEIGDLAGYHLDRAYRYVEELGPIDDRGRRLSGLVVDRLLAGGRRAHARFDAAAATKLFGRVDQLMVRDDRRRPEMLFELADALMVRAEFARAEETYGRAVEAAGAAGQRGVEGCAALARTLASGYLHPEGAADEQRLEGERWLPVFEKLGDDRGLAMSYRTLAETDHWHMRFAACGEKMYRAAEHARAAGDRRIECDALEGWITSAIVDPSPPAEIAARLDEFRRRAGEDTPWTQRWIAHVRGHLAALAGDLGEARRLHREAQDLAGSVGDVFAGWSYTECIAGLEEVAGNWEEAEALYSRGLEFLESVGDVSHASTWAAQLGRVLAIRGDPEALRYADMAERLTASEDVASLMMIRQARALALAAKGDLAAAESLAREAVALAAGTDFLSWHGEALADLASVLEMAGRPEEAADALREAITLYERKGDLAHIRRESARLQAIRR